MSATIPGSIEHDHMHELDAVLDKLPELPLRPADVYTRSMFKVVLAKALGWKAVGPSAVHPPYDQVAVPTSDVIPNILAVPLDDEDVTNVNFAKGATFNAMAQLPFFDDPRPWPSEDEARSTIAVHYDAILPKRSVIWGETSSDHAIELLALQGLAAHRLTRVENDPFGATFAVDLTFLHGRAVREGYLPYGACAYFTSEGRLARIYTSHDDRTHAPGDPMWEHAKWTWRVSLFTAVTLVDHLGTTHYLTSNVMVRASRETLPPDHPIRRLLKPFTYGAVDINRDALRALSNEQGIAHRLFAFTYPELVRLLLRGTELRPFQTFPEAIAEMRAESLGERFRFATDGIALYRVFQRYVDDYIAIYFTPEGLVADPAIRAFWSRVIDLAPGFDLGPLASARQIHDLLTQYMFWVTGGHAQVGGVVDYLYDPTFMGARIRPGATQADIQDTLQALNLTVITGLEQPTLLGDYHHVFLTDSHRPEVIAAFDRFQDALRELSRSIDARNAGATQAFQTFNPAILDTSVST